MLIFVQSIGSTSLRTSLLESYGDEEDSEEENEDVGAYVEYRALTADDNQRIRVWLAQ